MAIEMKQIGGGVFPGGGSDLGGPLGGCFGPLDWES